MLNIGDEIRIQGYLSVQYSGRIIKLNKNKITVLWYIHNSSSDTVETNYDHKYIKSNREIRNGSFYVVTPTKQLSNEDKILEKCNYLWKKSNFVTKKALQTT